MKRIWLSALAGLTLLAMPTLAQVSKATVTGGKLEGVVADGIASFKGIPFAAPPVGDLRWRAPQPVVPWRHTRKAARFAAYCMQGPGLIGPWQAGSNMSEDCLYLNVWTPAKSAAERLPVMVSIHGGGFAVGMAGSALFDGANLARRGVVVVTIQYRLNVFGFLAHPELSKESGHGSGDFGLEDQIAALKWVRTNIAAFGGDPANVTIFGESAGGMSVSMLCASPLARGLFAKAVSQSGGSFAGPKFADEGGMNVFPLATAEGYGKEVFAALGVRDLAAARALPAAVVLKGAGNRFWPVFDGYVLPEDQYLLYQADKFNDTPILIGTNADEGALFVKSGTPEGFEKEVREGYGAKADAILAAYPHATIDEAFKASKDLMGDTSFNWPTWTWARLQTEHGKSKAFVYLLQHRTAQQPTGAWHGADIPFFFGNLAGPGTSPSPNDRELADQVMGYIVDFARTGDPNGPGLPAWPAFSASDQQVLQLDPTGAIPYPYLDRLKVLDDYYAWRREQAAGTAQ